jgi:hypothetical protein
VTPALTGTQDFLLAWPVVGAGARILLAIEKSAIPRRLTSYLKTPSGNTFQVNNKLVRDSQQAHPGFACGRSLAFGTAVRTSNKRDD